MCGIPEVTGVPVTPRAHPPPGRGQHSPSQVDRETILSPVSRAQFLPDTPCGPPASDSGVGHRGSLQLGVHGAHCRHQAGFTGRHPLPRLFERQREGVGNLPTADSLPRCSTAESGPDCGPGGWPRVASRGMSREPHGKRSGQDWDMGRLCGTWQLSPQCHNKAAEGLGLPRAGEADTSESG